MSQRYLIRVYEDVKNKGETAPGTIVQPVDSRNFGLYAYSAEEVEVKIRENIAKKKLSCGAVYQICPWVGNAELIRSTAVSLDGSFVRVFLDPASGVYGELRRIRLPRPTPPAEEEIAIALGAGLMAS